MKTLAFVISITVFAYIIVIKNLINCDKFIDYKNYTNYIYF